MTLLQTADPSHFRVWATEFACNVAETYGPDCIILFGSLARGEHTVASDIDIVVIGGDLPANRRDRFRTLMGLRPRFAPIQVQSLYPCRMEADAIRATRHCSGEPA